MSRLPEGIRRLCIVVGAVLVVVMLFTMGHTLDDYLEMRRDHLAFVAAVLFGFYLAPFLVCKVVLWIKDGFSRSEH